LARRREDSIYSLTVLRETGSMAGALMGFSPLTTEAKDNLFAARGDGMDSEKVDGEGVGTVASLVGEATCLVCSKKEKTLVGILHL
jgi:hypothetical protein